MEVIEKRFGDLKWQMVMLTIRDKRFLMKTGRKGSKGEQEQRTCKKECDSGNNRCKSFDGLIWIWLDIHLRDNALTELRKKLEKAEKERDEIKISLEKFENSSKTLNKMLDSQVNDKSKTGIGYHTVPPPYTGNFMPPKPYLILADVDKYVVSESVTSVPAVATNKAKTKLRKKLEKAEKERDEIKISLEKFENSSKTLNKMLDSQVNDKSKTGIGYHTVPPPYTGNFMPPKPYLILADVDKYVVSESVTSVPAVATNKAKTSKS
nr:hypothetical protein [Tanacetum cinerariifolium]